MNHPGVPQHRLDTEAFGGAELFDLFADPSGIPKIRSSVVEGVFGLCFWKGINIPQHEWKNWVLSTGFLDMWKMLLLTGSNSII